MSLFSKLNLKVAIIEDVAPHPNADKLYVLKIDCGQKRQLVAGIKQFYSPEQLKGKHIIIISNLKPAMLRGIESQGMLLAAQVGDVVKVLEAPKSNAGEQVFIDGESIGAEQITIDDFAQIKLTTKDQHAVFNGKQLKTKNEEVFVDINDDATIR